MGSSPLDHTPPQPDASDLAEHARQQSHLVRQDPTDNEVLDWIEAVADTAEWS
ncbi:antitoxin MazE-like protein [Larsenimonas rhizosphaerae]|uniref:DUF3018 family protein n=1 Tax=Larsenimonas rhizosphaerae TaxID=2944682 RepID=A0AA42CVF7_9GAMM|nr:antitoxin MazE-like protein [Larsenimonas rhizosphaerae]MCX2525577.1 DUF3018 family protein [Larsenimonas rhizosphaerae]